MSPPRGRMPTDKAGWIFYWLFTAALPIFGALVGGRDVAIFFGVPAVFNALVGAVHLFRRRRQ